MSTCFNFFVFFVLMNVFYSVKYDNQVVPLSSSTAGAAVTPMKN